MKRNLFCLILSCLVSINVAMAQGVLVKGNVKDSAGYPIIGATIVVQDETSIGVITDIDGNFELNVPAKDDILTISYVGYETVKVPVKGNTKVDVVLKESTMGIDEVVVVGYGSQRKTDVTSSVASIKSEDFSSVVTTSSPLEMVQGKVPGLAMSRSGGGDPTAEMSIQIRGVSTLNAGMSPLVVIDGVPGGNLNTVSPNDIESIDVLRDGSAAAIYGSRGTSGVIIVTTKKGKYNQRIQLSYEGTVSVEQLYNSWDVLTGDQYRDLKKSFEDSDDPNYSLLALPMSDYGGNINAFKEITQVAVNQQHYVTLNGGSENANVSASINYRDNDGTLAYTGMSILNGRIASEFKHFNDMLTVNANMSYTEKKSSALYQRYLQNYSVIHALIWNPTQPLYDENGDYTQGDDPTKMFNPVNMMKESNILDKSTNFLGNLKATLRPVEGLTLTALMSMQKRFQNYGSYFTSEHQVMKAEGHEGTGTRKYTEGLNKTLDLTANYTNAIHKLRYDVLGGYSYQESNSEGFNMTNSDFAFDDLLYNNIGSGSDLKQGLAKMASNKGESKLISFFGRVVLNYDDRYLFNATVRHEGSSRFGLNNQWGTFPSASFAWRVVNEPFMKNQNFFDDLKLRLGYGVTGNTLDVNYVNYILYSAQKTYYYDGSGWNPTYSPKSNANPNLQWETKRELNFGLDMSLLNSRLTANVDAYLRKSDNLLYEYFVSVPPYLSDKMWGNIGAISNKGVEVNINAIPFDSRDFTWTINLNGSYNKNNVDRLTIGTDVQKKYDFNIQGDLYQVNAVLTQEGQPLGNFYSWKYAGVDESGKTLVYQLDENGDIKKDESGENMTILFSKTKGSYKNRTIVGNGMPKYYLNMGHTLRYKNIDLSMLFRGVFGFDILNVTDIHYGYLNFSTRSNVLESALDNPALDISYTDRNIEKGDFVKFDHITLGYNLPFKANNFISKVRLYATVQNVCTFTSYSGNNPELEISGTVVGVEKTGSYPISRVFSLGTNINF